jgi:hypothetical protein
MDRLVSQSRKEKSTWRDRADFSHRQAEPDDERVTANADEHIAVEQKADAAKHLLLFDVLHAGQRITDARREIR